MERSIAGMMIQVVMNALKTGLSVVSRFGRSGSDVLVDFRSLLAAIMSALLCACSNAPYRFETSDQSAIAERAESQDSGGFQVRASVPGAEESEALFGIDVYERNVQPVWLEVTNNTDSQARVVISSIDPKYYPPAEVAYFFRKQFSKEGWMALEARLINLALPRFVAPGETASGYVFTNLDPGSKAFNLDIFEGGMPPVFEQFSFFLRVPGFVPDYADVRFRELYPENELVEVDPQNLAHVLSDFPCCSRSHDGTRLGRPVDAFVVAEPYDLVRALLRAGWFETGQSQRDLDPEDQFYMFERPADGVFRKPQDRSADRSELDVWKTPVVMNGKPVWAAQLRHAIGKRFPLGERLFGVRLNPNTNEGRDYLLQDFWYAQSLQQWAAIDAGLDQSESAYIEDFLGNPWFSADGLQYVIWLAPDPVAMDDVIVVDIQSPRHSAGGDSE